MVIILHNKRYEKLKRWEIIMESIGKVSLWIGNFKDEVELNNYACLGYTADGDQIYSQFANEFDFGHTDDDLIEYEFFHEELISIDELLEHFSYGKIIYNRFKEVLSEDKTKKSINSAILLYDFEYEEDIMAVGNVEYVGCVSYL